MFRVVYQRVLSVSAVFYYYFEDCIIWEISTQREIGKLTIVYNITTVCGLNYDSTDARFTISDGMLTIFDTVPNPSSIYDIITLKQYWNLLMYLVNLFSLLKNYHAYKSVETLLCSLAGLL